MRTIVVLIDCPQCERPLTVNQVPEDWEHGVNLEKRRLCACGEIVTITVRVTREEQE